MVMRAELYDGTLLEFPDGTAMDVIKRVAREQTAIRHRVNDGQGSGADSRLSSPSLGNGPETGSATAQQYPVPPEAAGIPIIDRDSAYIAGNPAIRTNLPAGGPERTTALQALDTRGQNEGIGSQIGRATLPLSQGLTFNYSDEMASGLDALLAAITGGDPAATYKLDQEVQRQELNRQRDEHPLASFGTEMLGGGAAGLGLARNGATIVGRMANEGLTNVVPRMAAGAAEGAAYGALAGSGGGSGTEDRLQAARDNMPLGAGIGAAAVPVVDVLGAIFNKARDIYVGTRAPERRAQEALVQSMARDQRGPQDLAQAVQDAAGAGQPDYRAVDAAGRNTQRLGAMAAKTPSTFRNEVTDTLAARQGAQGQRIGNYVDQALGATGPDAYATEQGILQGRRAAADQMFQTAFDQAPPAGSFYDQLLQKPIVQQALKSMRTAAANSVDGMKDPIDLNQMVVGGQPGTVGDGVQGLSVRGWDYVRRYLRTYADALYNGSSEDKALAPVYKDLRAALQDRLASDVPGYADALAKYADDTAGLEAIQTGRDMIKARNADEATAAYKAIDPQQRDLAKIGAARETGVQLENARAGQDKTLMFDTPNMQGKLDTLVEDPLARTLLGERLGRERDMVRAGRAMTGGSNTYENMVDGTSGASGGALAALFSGRPDIAFARGAGYLLGHIARGAMGLNEQSANAIGDYLMSADPAKLRTLNDLFQEYLTSRNAPTLWPSTIAAGANAPRDQKGSR